MNLYVLINSSENLRDKFFDLSILRGITLGSPNAIFWHEFGEALKRAGVTAHTFDLWSPAVAKPDDILFVTNHPGETFWWRLMYYFKYFKQRGGLILERRRFLNKNYKHFSKRILVQIEPWVSQPYVYKHLEALRNSGIYTKMYLNNRGYGDTYDYFDYFKYWNRDIASPFFDAPKNKFLVLFNSNVAPHSLTNELYSERLRAIRYFSDVPGFDLYGWRWDKTPRHPFYFHYGKYVKKVWRGSPRDKIKPLSEYKFSICFENCIVKTWVTEKIYDCFAAGCVPIYLGAPDIAEIVPPECFIDFRKFKNYGDLHKFLAEMPEARITEYRAAIRKFLASRTKQGGVDAFVKEILN